MEKLLEDVETFLKARSMTPTEFGKKAMSDPNFVFDLRSGRDMKMSTVERVRRFMLEYAA